MDTRDMNISMDLRPAVPMDRKTCPRHLNAIILCENSLVAFRNAPQLLTRFGEHSDLQPRTWTFDALSVPSTRAAALQTARDAGVILVSAQGDADLPSTVQSFLRQAVNSRPELPKPIALLTGASTDSTPSSSNVGRHLRHLAKSTGTEFFVLAPPPPEAAIPRDNGAAPDESTPATKPTPRRHWGINE